MYRAVATSPFSEARHLSTTFNLIYLHLAMAKAVLMVDDSASRRQVVNIAFASADYEVIETCDGVDALTKLNNRKIHRLPKLGCPLWRAESRVPQLVRMVD